MGAMSTQASIPTGRRFARADLAVMPDEGNRYEFVDGRAERPFPVTVLPARLLGGTRP